MICTKPINGIDWGDVENFCQQQIREGAFLDYKVDFPSQLEKTISAMANALGGVIIIGVEENDENKPIVPIKGIPFVRGLSERVTSIILSNITPPVSPEIQVCRNLTTEKAIVVIRIPQSHQAPHAISNNTKVYLRTGDLNNPEEFASVDDISWLSNSRKKSIILRESITQQAEKRWKAFYKRIMEYLVSRDIEIHETNTGILTLSACPIFPHDEYRNPSQLSQISWKDKSPRLFWH